MCGFLVEFRKKKIYFNRSKFNKAANLISHRGPDQSGELHLNDISMKFYRLSIRDVSKNGSQPMWDISNRYLIVFNGEIYNSESLKKKLKNINLKGTSDTEILVNLYARYKKEILNLIDGMFSFLIYDKMENSCFIARDRFGIKPLYYFTNNEKILFCSEIKPIIKYQANNQINIDAFKEFFFKGYIDHNDMTFFKNIKTLEPASYLNVKKNYFVKRKYWKIYHKNEYGYEYKKKDLKDLIDKSVNSHIVSDRKIGIFLSGGTDSSILAKAISKKLGYKLKTFTYDFENNRNFGESNFAKKIANNLKLNNHVVKIESSEVSSKMENMCLKLESPFTSIRLFGTDKLYEIASKENIKVIIEGHGGDEMLAGYGYHLFPLKLDQLIKFKKVNQKNIESVSNLLSKNEIEKQNLISSLFNQGLSTTDGTPYFEKNVFSKNLFKKKSNILSRRFISNSMKKIGFLKNSQLIDIEKIKLPRILKYSDRLSMNHGIECRVPLLDHNLFKFCFHLDHKDKFRNNTTRYLFKKIFEKDMKYYFTKNKRSIVDPQTHWLKNELKEYVYDNFSSTTVKNSDLFIQKNLLGYYKNFLNDKVQNSFQIFNILTSINFIKTFKNL